MKKALMTIAALYALALTSCNQCNSSRPAAGDNDTIAADTVVMKAVVVDKAPQAIETTGIAVDGAMNSIYIKVGTDTVEYSYPDLEQAKRAAWTIGDTVTVIYAKTATGDSVIELR